MKSGVLLIALLGCVACEKKDQKTLPPPPAPQAQGQGQAQPLGAAAMGAAAQGAPGMGAPGQGAAAAAKAETTLTGKILETMGAGGYSYVRLKTATGEVWAAVSKAQLTVGEELSVRGFPMRGFKSPSLNRTFDEIYFGSVVKGGAAAPAAGAAAAGSAPAMPGHPPMGAAPAAPPVVTKQVRAAGPTGRTVAEVYAEREKLEGKPVTVRGVVVKVNRNVMDRTWVHLRDGSGSAADKTDDLTLTSTGDVQVGDIVLAEGTVKTNQKFGAGYSYSVLVEGARFTNEGRAR